MSCPTMIVVYRTSKLSLIVCELLQSEDNLTEIVQVNIYNSCNYSYIYIVCELLQSEDDLTEIVQINS